MRLQFKSHTLRSSEFPFVGLRLTGTLDPYSDLPNCVRYPIVQP